MRHSSFGPYWAMLFSILILGFTSDLRAQSCVVLVESTDDYTVEITMTPTQLIAPNSCTNGYNFDVGFSYDIQFTGANPPMNGLWTLQGTMDCDNYSNISFPLPNSGGTGTGQTNGNPYNPNMDCTTATPQSLGCTTFNLEIQGPGIQPTQFVSCEAALPVEMSFFHATAKDDSIDLNWQTRSEINNSHFVVQRSDDASTWVDLDTVEGRGNSTETEDYAYVDKDPFSGDNFYRLAQVDYDGSRHFSAIVETYLESHKLSKVYPNPFGELTNVTNVSGSVVIYSQMGEEVRKFSFNEENPQTVELDLSDLPAGLYFLRDHKQVLKLIKE